MDLQLQYLRYSFDTTHGGEQQHISVQRFSSTNRLRVESDPTKHTKRLPPSPPTMPKRTAIEVLFQSTCEWLSRIDPVTFLLEVYDSTTVDVGDDSRRACVSVDVSTSMPRTVRFAWDDPVGPLFFISSLSTDWE